MNPLYNEYKKARLYTLLLVVGLAVVAATIDYFMVLNQRIVQRQQLLLSAAEDMEHQLAPVVHLLQVLKQDAEASLLVPQDAPESLAGQQWSLRPADSSLQLSDTEKSMLNSMLPQLQLAQRTSSSIKQFSYVSSSGVWFVPAAQRSAVLELQAQLFWQQKEQLPKLTGQQLRLHRLNAAETVFMLSLPLMHNGQPLGELVLNFDLAAMLQRVAKGQPDSTIELLNDIGEPLLTVVQGQVMFSADTEQQHHSDRLRTLTILPVTLHLEPADARSALAELRALFLHFMLYLLSLLALWWYVRHRFRNKVLAPFQRLLVHVERLGRGDPQGVRHIPADWLEVFHQVELLRDNNPDQNSR